MTLEVQRWPTSSGSGLALVGSPPDLRDLAAALRHGKDHGSVRVVATDDELLGVSDDGTAVTVAGATKVLELFARTIESVALATERTAAERHVDLDHTSTDWYSPGSVGLEVVGRHWPG